MTVITAEELRDRFPDLAQHATSDEVSVLLNTLGLRRIPAGHVLVHDGEKSNTMFLVLDGRLVAYIESETVSVELGHIEPGEWVGELAVLCPGPATATVKAETDCTLLSLSEDDFCNLDRAHPALTSKILRMLSAMIIERLIASDELLLRGREIKEAAGGESHPSVREWATRVYRKLTGHGEKAA